MLIKSLNISSALSAIVIMVMLLFPDYIQAQTPSPESSETLNQLHNFDNGLSIGASLNYGGLYFESDSGSLNDIWSSSAGYGFHVMYALALTPVFAVNAGASFFVNRYSSEEQRTPFTDETGQPTGPEFVTTLDGTVGTSYAGIPLNLVVRPLSNKSVFLKIGPEIGLKVAHKNGTSITRLESPADENSDGTLLDETEYEGPEQSNNPMLFINAGFGYSLDSAMLPLDITLGLKQSATKYVSGDNLTNNWLRHVTFTVSYRL